MAKKESKKVEFKDGDLMDLIDAVGWGCMHLIEHGKQNKNWKVARLVHLKRILGILQYALGKEKGIYYEPNFIHKTDKDLLNENS